MTLSAPRINDHLFGSLSVRDFQSLETLAFLLDEFNYTVRLVKTAAARPNQSVA
jgi:hypothetical protein